MVTVRSMITPSKPKPGDRVAIVSPSAGLPGLFPRPYELGLRRLRDDFGLVPVEYPTTRVMGAAPADRAADLHAAFADPTITAVITSIGGDDQRAAAAVPCRADRAGQGMVDRPAHDAGRTRGLRRRPAPGRPTRLR